MEFKYFSHKISDRKIHHGFWDEITAELYYNIRITFIYLRLIQKIISRPLEVLDFEFLHIFSNRILLISVHVIFLFNLVRNLCASNDTNKTQMSFYHNYLMPMELKFTYNKIQGEYKVKYGICLF